MWLDGTWAGSFLPLLPLVCIKHLISLSLSYWVVVFTLLYVLGYIDILGEARMVSMFGVNFIKCQLVKLCLAPIY